MERYCLLDAAQKAAIARFLAERPKLVELDHEDQKIVERALRNYWGQYLQTKATDIKGEWRNLRRITKWPQFGSSRCRAPASCWDTASLIGCGALTTEPTVYDTGSVDAAPARDRLALRTVDELAPLELQVGLE